MSLAKKTSKYHFNTKLIHVGQEAEQWTHREVIPPISLSTTFKQPSPGKPVTFDYTRACNATRACLEKCLADLEDAKYACVFSSGLSALTSLVHCLQSGDHIICGEDVYGGTGRFLRHAIESMAIELTMIDTTQINEIKNAIKSNTKLVWIESPTNPTMVITDIVEVAKICHNRDDKIILAVDNTFLTPFYQKPLNLGADLSVYSMTKYMNGHSDCLMGAIVTNHDKLGEKLKYLQMSIGAVPSPFDCFLANRGLKTLHLRMERHMLNGLKVIQFLQNHPKVIKVYHPYLANHPQHELFKKQTTGFSGMVSFVLKGDSQNAVNFVQNLTIFTLAESLGGVESLAEIPSIMTHASVPAELRKKLGIDDSLIRLSVGIEHIDDLINDLENAFEKC